MALIGSMETLDDRALLQWATYGLRAGYAEMIVSCDVTSPRELLQLYENRHPPRPTMIFNRRNGDRGRVSHSTGDSG